MPAHLRFRHRPGLVSTPRLRRRSPAHVLGSLLALLGPSACFDPDPTPLDGGDETTGSPSTSTGPVNPDSTDGGSVTSTTGSSGLPEGSSGTTTGLGSSTADTSTSEPVVESSSGESSSSGGESSTGEPPADGYGDCTNNPPDVVCLPDEQCLNIGVPVAACAEQGCAAASDCAQPLTGNPTVTCQDIDGNASNDCYLSCAGGETCPDGMICFGFFLCVWPFPPGMCPDQDLGSAVPQSIMGDNTGLGDDHTTSCGNGGGEDATYEFTAPVAATYVFDTYGTAYDTILSVLDGCGGAELACNDDSMGTYQSQVMVPLAAGQTVILVVDGYSATTGPFILNITSM